VPSKTGTLGKRTVQALVSQNSFYNKTICAYQNVTFNQGVAIQGDVGSEGTAVPDLSLQGPSGSAARIQPAFVGGQPVQPGNAYAVSTVSCAQSCPAQVAGTVNNNQPAGTVCPNIAQVWSTYTCVPGITSPPPGGAITISSANNSLNNVTLGSGGSITFVTAGPTDVLTVNVNSISAGSNTQFIIQGNAQGAGIVVLNVKSQLTVGQGSFFGLSYPVSLSPLSLVPAGHLIVRSCNTGTPTPAIWFNQSGGLSAVFIAPYGKVQMDQAQNSQGAILAQNVQLDQGTAFGFDASASAVGLGFSKLVCWQDLPTSNAPYLTSTPTPGPPPC
jgi:hypothetical protein